MIGCAFLNLGLPSTEAAEPTSDLKFWVVETNDLGEKALVASGIVEPDCVFEFSWCPRVAAIE